MRSTILLLVLPVTTLIVQAQKTQPLKPVLELKMPKTEDDDKPGTRGASVVWHPAQKKYYAVFAGNVDYPLAVFDEKGKRLSPDDQIAMMDTRGLWYDPATKLVTGNAYNDNGWFTYKLDTKGLPADVNVVREGMNQPDGQSVGAYNATAKKVLFVYNRVLYTYNNMGILQDSLIIHWGVKKSAGTQDHDDDEDIEDYNYTSLIYTGQKGQELGFLNVEKNQVELYDIQNGFLAKIVPLPETATPEASFNFSYSNGIYWLFDMDNRTWVGYK